MSFPIKLFLLILFLFPIALRAQYQSIPDIPLPERFKGLQQKGLTITSTPNPNWASFQTDQENPVAWKHSTHITAKEATTVIETGAYLLHYGTWKKRAAFDAKATKKMFDTKKLTLKAGETLTFEKNWRYGSYTQTGWNFWYVIGKTATGEQVFDYEILETKGQTSEGLQRLPLSKANSRLEWTGKAGDSDYSLSGTIDKFSGALTVQGEIFTACSISLDMTSLNHSNAALVKHLKNQDFFHVKKHPTITFNSTLITAMEDQEYQVTGELCLLGFCREETWFITLNTSTKAFEVYFETELDRTQYGMLYASSKDSRSNYSIADKVSFKGVFSFTRDYPGSKPWNSVEAKPAN